MKFKSSRPEVFLGKGYLRICSKFKGKHPFRNVISIKLLCNFIEIALRHGCSPVNSLYIFRTLFLRNISRGLLLEGKLERWLIPWLKYDKRTAQKMKFSIKDFFTKCDQIRRNLRI